MSKMCDLLQSKETVALTIYVAAPAADPPKCTTFRGSNKTLQQFFEESKLHS